MSWRFAKIGEVCDLMTGGTPSTAVPEYYADGDIPWVASGDIHRLHVLETDKKITQKGMENSPAKYLPKDSVLIALNGQGKTRGTVAMLRLANATCNQSVVSINSKNIGELDNYYLFHLLRSMYKSIRNITGDKDRTGLNMRLIAEIEIPLPPLEEQRRIAAILDQADELRRKRQRALDRLNQLGQAIFIEMFGDPATNPFGWSIVRLGEITRAGDRINYGVVQPGDEVEDGVPLIRVGDLLKPFIDPSLVKHIDPAIEGNYSRSRLVGDELLIGCVGSIGTVALAHPGLKGANIARAVARVPIDESKADRRFLAEMIRSSMVQRYFAAQTRAVAQPTLNIGLIADAPIVLPPLELQRQYSSTLERIEPIATALGSSAVASTSLFACLQHRAFRGELTSPNLKDAAA